MPARSSPESPTRLVVAGIGYGNLRDMSFGPIAIERLSGRPWPSGVELHDMSYGAVAALHWFQEHPGVEAAVFVGAAERGRAPGSLHRHTWAQPPFRTEDVQARVEEAVTGIVGLDTLLTVVGHFGALPRRVTVLEVEPHDQNWGPELSPPVEAVLGRLEQEIDREIAEVLG